MTTIEAPLVTFSTVKYESTSFFRGDIKNRDLSQKFKGYLKDSDITYQVIDSELPLWSLNFPNGKIANRIVQKLKLTFDVFAEEESEVTKNYSKLETLLKIIKPIYYPSVDGYAHTHQNNAGYFMVECETLPIDGPFKLNLTNFSYEINKDFGYLNKNNTLYPISYRISIDGKILQDLSSTINISVDKTFASGIKNENKTKNNVIAALDIMIKKILLEFTEPTISMDTLMEKYNSVYVALVEAASRIGTYKTVPERTQIINELIRAYLTRIHVLEKGED